MIYQRLAKVFLIRSIVILYRHSLSSRRRAGTTTTRYDAFQRSHRRQHLVRAIIGVEFAAALPPDRGATRGGWGISGTLNEQLRPSALRPALPPAANAALVAVMQDTSNAAMRISIVNLMARSFPRLIVTS